MRTSGKVRAGFATILLLSCVLFLGSFRQTNAVRMKWTSYVVHKQNGEADVHFVGTIPNGWKIYSQSMEGKIGPLGTTFEFDPSDAYETVGDVNESGKSSKFYDAQYGFEVACLEGQVHYIQHIKIKDEAGSFVIKAVVNYMLNRPGESLSPDDEDFDITIQ